VGAATGFFNLTRQLGGSIGVALLTTLIDKRQVFHQAVLSEHVVSNDPSTLERLSMLTRGLVSRGVALWDAQQQALALLAASVKKQAAVLSFNDSFWATFALIVVTLPLVALLGKPRDGADLSLGH
jgi:DHA2 family multidrug resistance protein